MRDLFHNMKAIGAVIILCAFSCGRKAKPSTQESPPVSTSNYEEVLKAYLDIPPCCEYIYPDVSFHHTFSAHLKEADETMIDGLIIKRPDSLLANFDGYLTEEDLEMIQSHLEVMKEEGLGTNWVIPQFACTGSLDYWSNYTPSDCFANFYSSLPREGMGFEALSSEKVRKMNREAISLDYDTALECYPNAVQILPCASGYRLFTRSWFLSQIDPEHQWELFRREVVVDYNKDGMWTGFTQKDITDDKYLLYDFPYRGETWICMTRDPKEECMDSKLKWWLIDVNPPFDLEDPEDGFDIDMKVWVEETDAEE